MNKPLIHFIKNPCNKLKSTDGITSSIKMVTCPDCKANNKVKEVSY